MSLDGRPPQPKRQKPKASPAYLQAVRELPCCICEAFGEPQLSPTEAHHWIMGRGGSKRTPDQEAVPLCNGHHSGDFDTSKIAIHRDRAAWREAYGEDRDYVAVTQDKIEQKALKNGRKALA